MFKLQHNRWSHSWWKINHTENGSEEDDNTSKKPKYWERTELLQVMSFANFTWLQLLLLPLLLLFFFTWRAKLRPHMATEATFTLSHVRSVSPPISAPPPQPKPKEHAPAIEQSAASSVLYLLQQKREINFHWREWKCFHFLHRPKDVNVGEKKWNRTLVR